ncbi:LacI family DNA-binding transcriptional regulator [Oenococcus alcoholitolerans]|uniref:LacI family DNA-binding transcriptional regulator n=1 Tax=Oenococcus alcoholitolerans TaxID=931074 RepID=UPI003F7103EA
MEEKKQPTIYDVAEKVGVSLATVSRVINNNGKVKESTRAKVLQAIKELDYRPNAMAKGLASSKTTMVGMIVPDLTNLYYAELAQGIDAVAKIYNYSVSLAVSDGNAKAEREAFDTLRSKQVDGVIYMGSNPSDEIMQLMVSSSVPVVFAGSVDPEGKFPSVNIDYIQAFSEAAGKLKENFEDSKIALVEDPDNSKLSQLRRQGFFKALPNGKTYQAEDEYQMGYNLGRRLLSDGIKAVIVAEDATAVGILNYVRDNHVEVPEDFQIISTSDTKLVKMTRPSISSVTQPKFDIGAVAMRLLTKLMSNQEVSDPAVILPHEFVLRETTK